MRAARVVVTCLLSALVAILLQAGPALADQGTTEKAFAPGGRIRLNLSAGDYTIKAGRDNRIMVAWQTNKDPDDNAKVRIATDATGKGATVITDGPHDNFRVVIEVPARSDLDVDLSAGNVRVIGVAGNKDIGSWAGNVDIEVPKPEDYAYMDLAVKAGDLNATALNVKKSGLFRSYRWKGPGHYTLRVRLTAGNLTLIRS